MAPHMSRNPGSNAWGRVWVRQLPRGQTPRQHQVPETINRQVYAGVTLVAVDRSDTDFPRFLAVYLMNFNDTFHCWHCIRQSHHCIVCDKEQFHRVLPWSCENSVCVSSIAVPDKTTPSASRLIAASTPSAAPLPWPDSEKFHHTSVNPRM